jgi:hypothetical protein
MEAQVPSQKPDFARIVLGCKGLNMMFKLHVPTLRWTRHVELSLKNPKEMGVLEKHNTKVSFWELKEIVKIMFSSIKTVSTYLAIGSMWIKIKPNEKAKQHRSGGNWMEFQQSMSYNF